MKPLCTRCMHHRACICSQEACAAAFSTRQREVMQGARTALHRVASSQLQAFLDLNFGLDRVTGRRKIIVLVCICPPSQPSLVKDQTAPQACAPCRVYGLSFRPVSRPHIPSRCLDLIHLVGMDADPTDPVGICFL
jgi:hypothetical protein